MYQVWSSLRHLMGCNLRPSDGEDTPQCQWFSNYQCFMLCDFVSTGWGKKNGAKIQKIRNVHALNYARTGFWLLIPNRNSFCCLFSFFGAIFSLICSGLRVNFALLVAMLRIDSESPGGCGCLLLLKCIVVGIFLKLKYWHHAEIILIFVVVFDYLESNVLN